MSITSQSRQKRFAMDEVSSHRLNPLRSAPNLLTLLRICLAPFLVAAILEGHYHSELRAFCFRGDYRCAGWHAGARAQAAVDIRRISRSGGRQAAAEHAVSGSALQRIDAGHRDSAGVRPGCGHPAGFGASLRGRGAREFRPSIWGKANTLAQIVAVAAVLLHQVTPSWYWVAAFRTVALDATIALTIISGLHYAWVVSRRSGATAANGK